MRIAPNQRAWLLVSGIVLAALTDALAGTILPIGQIDMLGDMHATPDEFAWLDTSYTAAKFIGFVLSPWLMNKLSAKNCVSLATGVMVATCLAATMTENLHDHIVLRTLQGLSGGVLLVCGQTILLQNFSRCLQPLLQGLFAIGAVVAPATLAPYIQGWMVDNLSWQWIFVSVVPIGLVALGLLQLSNDADDTEMLPSPLDVVGFVLFAASTVSIVYVLNRGARWNWDDNVISLLTVIGIIALVLFVFRLVRNRTYAPLLDIGVFKTNDFLFGSSVCAVAGFVLFGSAHLIPDFTLSMLGFSASKAGQLLLPSAGAFIATMFLTVYLIHTHSWHPITTVPLGITLFMLAMWIASGSTSGSGPEDLMLPVILRGFGLGFLFLSLNLIAFLNLPRMAMAHGVAIFNITRLVGGLVGVAWLETLVDRQSSVGRTILAAHLGDGNPDVAARLSTLANSLVAKGVEPTTALNAAGSQLFQTMNAQATVIGYDAAFFSLILIFFIAVPFFIALRVILTLRNKK